MKFKNLFCTDAVTDEEYQKLTDFVYDIEIATALTMGAISIIWRIVC